MMLLQVPYAWREDPKWRSSQGAGNRKGYSHKADYPSRWIPAKGRRHSELDDYDGWLLFRMCIYDGYYAECAFIMALYQQMYFNICQ